MVPPKPDPIQEIYQREGRRVFATLVRVLGSFELAEDALHNAFVAAAEGWPREGIPKNPVAWLVSAGRFKAIDQLRRQQRMTPWSEAAEQVDTIADEGPAPDEREVVEDDRLRLIFTCCHPSLSEEACIALTLREVCGLTTEAIAHACLRTPTTLAQRIVRAKAKIRDAGIPYQVPDKDELPARLKNVLRVIYLVFSEGYSASSGVDLLKRDLSAEAIRLARLLLELLPEPEAQGLLALLLFQDSRRPARITPEGDLIPLEEQDRSLWNRASIAEGCDLVRQALHSRGFGAYTLQAAIAAVHAEARSPQETDWAEIAGLYDALLRLEPSPIVHLNRAVAVAMRDGPEAGLVSSTKAALATTALPTRQKPIYCAASGASLRPRPAMRRRWPSRSRSPNSGSSSADWPESAANARKFFRAPVESRTGRSTSERGGAMTAASLRTGNYLSMERVIMAQAIPYLAFNGNCSEAMRFYERVLGLGAKLEMMMSGADSPMAAQIPKEHAHRILHARLRFDDGSYIYAGDTPVQMPCDGIRGATITMIYPSSAEAERVFKALSEGGKITMPLGPMFWAKSAGMLTDKFGTRWAINGEVII